MTNLAENPDWFDRRRFVIERPDTGNWTDGRKQAVDGWGVRDLSTNIIILTDVTVEESGLYADTLETKYNRYLPKEGSNRE